MNFENYYTNRAKPLQASGIREMFKLMADPAVISLAGGSPDPVPCKHHRGSAAETGTP